MYNYQPIEKMKAFNEIKTYLSSKDKENLFIKLGLNEIQNIEKRMGGLSNEDEFALILLYLNCCKHIVSIDEKMATLTNSNQADFLLCLKSGENILVEVKSETSDKYSISMGNLEKRMNFAKDLNLTFYFALKIKGLWTLIKSDYIFANNGKITFEEAINNSVFNKMFETYYFYFPMGLEIERVQQKSFKEESFMKHCEDGELIEYQLSFNGRILYKLQRNSEMIENEIRRNAHLILPFEAIENYMTLNIEKIDEDKTIVKRRLETNLLVREYEMFTYNISNNINIDGSPMNATDLLKYGIAYIKGIDKNTMENIGLSQNRFLIKRLIDMEVPIEIYSE